MILRVEVSRVVVVARRVAVARVALARVLARVASSSRAPRIASSRVVARAKCGARARRRRANKSRTLRHPGRFSLENHARDKSRVSRALDARTRGGDRASSHPPFSDARPSVDTMGVRLATLDARRDALDARSTRRARISRRARDARRRRRRERVARALIPRARRRGGRRRSRARRRPPTPRRVKT